MLSHPRLRVLAVIPAHQIEPDPVQRLAWGVFNLALRDSGLLRNSRSGRIDRKVQNEAIDFLTSGGEDFCFWCRLLDQNPSRVQSVLRKRLTTS